METKITHAADIDNKKIVYDGCMVTASGKVVNLMDPDPKLITILDIAHGLSNTCRWNGHTNRYWSVAQHCCMMYDFSSSEMKLTALMHDAEEAYWGDIIKPLKNVLKEKCPEIVNKMTELRNIIFQKFQVPAINDEVENNDFLLLEWEFERIILHDDADYWTPERSKAEFLSRYYQSKNV